MLKWISVFLVLFFLSACGQPPRSYLVGEVAESSNQLKPAERRFSSSEQTVRERKPIECNAPMYTVVKDDTLSHIAFGCGISLEELARANSLQPPYIIYPKQELIIPGRKPIHTSEASADALYDWLWPIETFHRHAYVQDTSGVQGLEIYADPQTEIRATEGGVVVYAGNSVSDFGRMVLLRHGNDYISVYAHNDSVLVREGQWVERGETIALLGSTGQTTVPKLYFEMRFKGRKVNAESLIKKPGS